MEATTTHLLGDFRLGAHAEPVHVFDLHTTCKTHAGETESSSEFHAEAHAQTRRERLHPRRRRRRHDRGMKDGSARVRIHLTLAGGLSFSQSSSSVREPFKCSTCQRASHAFRFGAGDTGAAHLKGFALQKTDRLLVAVLEQQDLDPVLNAVPKPAPGALIRITASPLLEHSNTSSEKSAR